MQAQQEAKRIVDESRAVFVAVKGSSGRTPWPLLKIPKNEAQALIRSPEWSHGFHVEMDPGFGPGVSVLEPCGEACPKHGGEVQT